MFLPQRGRMSAQLTGEGEDPSAQRYRSELQMASFSLITRFAGAVSLRLGHAAALTCPRHVIHLRGAASLPQVEGLRNCVIQRLPLEELRHPKASP